LNILVQKFGGTSVATSEKRQMVVKKISNALQEGYYVVAIVSAMGRKGEAYATDTLKGLVNNDKSTGISKKDLDLLMSCGEIISSVVMVSELKSHGINATCYTGGQAGIITDEGFNDARIIQVKPAEIIKELENNNVVVVAGFQGVTKDGRITTLGRGGSDTTAAALAVALRAVRIDIYTDVDGVKTADPKIVNNAKTLSKVTYNEICQMAHEGARVIHPRAVEIAMQGNIPIRILSTFSDAEGTWITNGFSNGNLITDIKNDKIVTGITYKSHVSQLNVTNINKDPQISLTVFQTLAKMHISVDFINVCEDKIIFTVNDTERDHAVAAISKLDLDIAVEKECAKVAVVGAGMTGIPGVMAKVVEALTESQIKILQSADSYTSIWCLVHQKNMEQAVRALHKKFELG
jgi:aspartate kinase